MGAESVLNWVNDEGGCTIFYGFPADISQRGTLEFNEFRMIPCLLRLCETDRAIEVRFDDLQEANDGLRGFLLPNVSAFEACTCGVLIYRRSLEQGNCRPGGLLVKDLQNVQSLPQGSETFIGIMECLVVAQPALFPVRALILQI